MSGLEIIALGASVMSGVMSAAGALQAGAQQQATAQYNADIARRNAALARQQAEADANDERRSGQRALAGIRAAYGSSGLTLAGSPLDVLEDSALEQELTVQKILYKGELRSMELREQARLSIAQGNQAVQGSYLSAAGSVLKAGSSLLSTPTASNYLRSV